MFYRKIQEKLNAYYSNDEAKIMIITGARQIGKSFIIRNTANVRYKNYIEINLKDDYNGERYFKNIKTVDNFYLQLSALYGDKLGNKDDTIVFLDEIQVYPELLPLLKPLKKDDRFKYIASGSLLGITLKHVFIPMGSIEEVKMYPMDFEEFLIAYNVGKDVIDYLKNCFVYKTQVSDNIHNILLTRFKEYLVCGGLPDSINEFLLNKNILTTRANQQQTYEFYKDDAAQYDEEHNLKIRTIYDFLPSYMDNKVKRVQFKKIENVVNASLLKYENEFDYLVHSGCALDAKAVSNPKFPLVSSSSKNLIKLYYNDVGILTNLLFKNNYRLIVDNDKGDRLGSAYETACAMELKAHGHELYYFDSKKVGEVDFLINDYDSGNLLAIEIKSGKDVNNYRALPKLVKDPYNIKTGIVLSNKNLIETKENITSYPIYMIMFV